LRPYCSDRPADALVFRPERGADALCGSALYRRFIDAADRAGLRRIRFHDLRHYRADESAAAAMEELWNTPATVVPLSERAPERSAATPEAAGLRLAS
jgi:integrase